MGSGDKADTARQVKGSCAHTQNTTRNAPSIKTKAADAVFFKASVSSYQTLTIFTCFYATQRRLFGNLLYIVHYT
jgi:hypothetical protein